MRILLSFLLSALLASAALAKDFEGIVHFQITANKRSQEMEYAIKEGRLRMSMDLGRGHSTGGIFDSKSGETYILMPEQKMYMVFGGVGKMARDSVDAKATIEETGRTDTIAGYKVAEYIVKDKDSTSELWATAGLGSFIPFSDVQRNKGKAPAWAEVIIEKKLFPLRTINKDRRGRVVTTMEATKVEPKKLDESLFQVPEDYQRFDMPNLGNMLKGLRP